MTCIGCRHLLIDGETAKCILRVHPPRSMRGSLTACNRHTEAPSEAHTEAPPEKCEPITIHDLPPNAREIIVAVANAFAITPEAAMSQNRKGTLNQHVHRRGSSEAMQRMTLAFARQAVIVLLLRGGFTESQVRAFLGRSPNTRFHAAKAAEPIMRSDRRLAGLFNRLLASTGV